MKSTNVTKYALLLGVLLMASSCADGTGSAGGAHGLSLSVLGTNGTANQTSTGQEMTLTDTANTLVLSSVQLVIRRIELARTDTMCSPMGDSTENHQDGPMMTDGWHRDRWGEWDRNNCEEVKIGPILVDVPLDGQLQTVFSADVPDGTYNGAEFWIHAPRPNDSTDMAFLADHPDFDSVSVKVEGTYDDTAFTYTHAIWARQAGRLDPALVITPDSGAANLTLQVDVGSWFMRRDSTLIDPNTAVKGGDNEWLVAWKIMKSFWTFKDHDRDGKCDPH